MWRRMEQTTAMVIARCAGSAGRGSFTGSDYATVDWSAHKARAAADSVSFLVTAPLDSRVTSISARWLRTPLVPGTGTRARRSRPRPRRVVELQRLSDRLHGLCGRAPRNIAPASQRLRHNHRLRLELPAALADRRQGVLEDSNEAPLHLDVADRSLHVPRLQLIDLLRIRIERVVIREHGIALDVTGVGRAKARRVRVHAHDLPLDGLRVVLQIDGIAPRLAHLGASVDPGQARNPPDEGLGLHEHGAVVA